MHTSHVEYTEQNVKTNQDLVAWPRNIPVDMDGRQSELRPEMVDELITSTQTQHFNEGRNLGHHPKSRVHHTTFVNNDVLREWVLPVSHDQRNPHYPLSLALYFCWTHAVPLIIQHFPAWRLQPQTLIARKVFAAPKVPQNLVVTMSQHQHDLATNSAIKMTGFCRNISGPSHKESPNITHPPSFLHLVRFLGRGSPTSLSSPLVSVVSPNWGRAREGLCSTCSSRFKTSSNPVNSKCVCKIWQGKIILSVDRKLCWTTNDTKERKHYVLVEKLILTRHNDVKKLRPLLSTNRPTQADQLVTCRLDGRDSRIGGKVV